MSSSDITQLPNDSNQPGQLFMVATPIGHLDDLTLRAIQILKTADVVLAEDTRVTKTLLNHIGAAPGILASANQYKEAALAQSVCEWLSQGKQVAFVSDAGTPGIADPGAITVNAARAGGFTVVPVPGASALASIMSVAGLTHGKVMFEGFLPSNNGARTRRLEALLLVARLNCAVALFEAPHRIIDSCQAIAAVWGDTTQIVIGRELTKKFEEVAAMPIGNVAAWLTAHEHRARGEFVVLISLPEKEELLADDQVQLDLMMKWLKELVPVVGTNQAAKLVSKILGVTKAVAYEAALSISTSDR
jgi:16S rRNA (cytidine1402-2'-O)-methyltransferase